ncbi:hypothetical protein BE04_25015 [Sorangium cellulosum]|uniref:Uncharacterized protein n=1 Tax=Sorangium cellulosum TaxID=56 RepID=A0A150PEI3_SORCE|nr:hypothetical protein BE04_25015 [Sorangium cellulosum]
MLDDITFTIRWENGGEAWLFSVIDNGQVKLVNTEKQDRKGEVSVAYQAASAPTHRIEWLLSFPEHTLRGLEAVATVNGGFEQRLSSREEETARWLDSGVATS